MEFLDSDARALIALQGPQAVTALENISSISLGDLYFMQTRIGTVAGVDGCRITRCGYTGLFQRHIFFLLNLFLNNDLFWLFLTLLFCSYVNFIFTFYC